MSNNVKVALALARQGISVVPLRTDGSKLPKIKWGDFQDRIMTPKEIKYHFADSGGIAAVTGKVSRLYCLDFDLKYQLAHQDFWKDFMTEVPKPLRKRMMINETRNAGKHIWVRTDFEDKSRKIARRPMLIPELMESYEEMIKMNADPLKVSEQLLKNPYEVVIESRSRGSYAVIYHPEYRRFYGRTINNFTIEEVELLNEIAYSLDYEFIHKEIFNGEPKHFESIRKFNDDASPGLILSLLEGTGMYKHVGTQRDGTIEVLRHGSKNKNSAKIFGDNAVLHVHSPNAPIFGAEGRDSFSPFEVWRLCNGWTFQEAVAQLTKK